MKILFTILFLLCMVSNAFAQSASQDWHGSWGFPTPSEKTNMLNQALAIELIEGGGFNTTNNLTLNSEDTYFQEQNCFADGSCFNATAISIGNNVEISGDDNLVTTENDANVSSQTNNGSGDVDQTDN